LLRDTMSAIVDALYEDHVSKDQCYQCDEGHQRRACVKRRA